MIKDMNTSPLSGHRRFFIGRGIVLLILLVLLAGYWGFVKFNDYIYTEKQGDQAPATSPLGATYVIEGQLITLKAGVSELTIMPGSASKITTRYFGNELIKDLDGDGRDDIAFLVTQEQGGSATFYYVVAALNKEGGYEGSQGMILGDRIAPQNIQSGPGKSFIVTYADRAPGESFAVKPSVGKSLRLILDPVSMQFGEVVTDFEGEANPAQMKLDMKSWSWISASYNDEREVVPKSPGRFVLTFTGTRFSASTDCNSIGGEYMAKDGAITFDKMISTKMYCEGSQEAEFAQILTNTATYHFTSKGELILGLKYDSGTALFR